MARDKKTKKSKWTLAKIIPWLLVIGGSLALFASFALTIEKFNMLQNPKYVPSCNLNPVLSCTTVTNSKQSHVFGFPNPFLGIAGYAAVVTIGVALLAGAKFKRWFWAVTNIGLLFAVAFIHWLMFQTLYRVGALCLYCMLVWSSTIPVFWYLTLYNFSEGNIKTPLKLQRFFAFIRRHHGDILLVWFLVIIFLIGKRFWYYWSTLL